MWFSSFLFLFCYISCIIRIILHFTQINTYPSSSLYPKTSKIFRVLARSLSLPISVYLILNLSRIISFRRHLHHHRHRHHPLRAVALVVVVGQLQPLAVFPYTVSCTPSFQFHIASCPFLP